MSNTKITPIEKSTPWGVYIWVTDDNKKVTDEDGNVMLITSARGDYDNIKAISDAARHYNIPGGRAVFLPGQYPVSDEEYEMQLARAEAGLIPDPLEAFRNPSGTV